MIALITIFELEQLTKIELEDLHLILLKLLMATKPNTADRRNILATLENIENILGQNMALKSDIIGYGIVYPKAK